MQTFVRSEGVAIHRQQVGLSRERHLRGLGECNSARLPNTTASKWAITSIATVNTFAVGEGGSGPGKEGQHFPREIGVFSEDRWEEIELVAIVAVVLALAVASEASWPAGPWGATVVQANAPAWPAAHWAGAPWAGAWPAAHWAGAWPAAAHWGGAYPYAAAHWGAPAASVAHHAGVVPGATSVTATRGAVHVAPLAGHAVSQKQLNLAPAPGTI